MAFRQRAYHSIKTLANQWNVLIEDLFYAIENDLLQVCAWMPLRLVESGVLQNGHFTSMKQEQKEGFVILRPQDFRVVASKGYAKLRIFGSFESEKHILRLTYEPPQPPLTVNIQDVVILKEEQLRFAGRYNLTMSQQSPLKPIVHFSHSKDYRHIELDKQHYSLGDVQAKIVEHLHIAGLNDQPWVHGKKLIDISGSRAVRMRDLFKHKEEWRQLILSDKRGYYRLNVSQETRSLSPNLAALGS